MVHKVELRCRVAEASVAAAVEVHVLPLVVLFVPYPGLLGLDRVRVSLLVDVLRESDVRDAGRVLAEDVHVRVQDGGVDGLVAFAEHVLEVELVEVHALDEVAEGLGLERR